MKSRKLIWIGAFLLFSFAVAFFTGARRARRELPDSETIEGLSVSLANLDLGDVWEDKAVKVRVPIRNITGSPIKVRDFSTSCGCTLVEPRSLSLPPQESATLDLTLDLTHRSLAESGLIDRPFSVSIQPVVRDGNSRGPGWKLHGMVKSRVSVDTLAVNFGERPIHGGPAVSEKLVAKVHVPCQALEVSINPAIAIAKVSPVKNEQGRFEIAISPRPTLNPGDFNAEVKIEVVEPSGSRTLALTLPIAGKMQAAVRVLPARVFLPPTEVGKTAEAVLTLQQLPNSNAVVDHIETESPGLDVEPTEVPGIPAGRAYRIRQRVSREGAQTAFARFVMHQSNCERVTLTVDISFSGRRAIATKAQAQGKEETP